jgi:hypothetical protein
MIVFRALQGMLGVSMIPTVFTSVAYFFRARAGSIPRPWSARSRRCGD